jgi:hypothetical protein
MHLLILYYLHGHVETCREALAAARLRETASLIKSCTHLHHRHPQSSMDWLVFTTADPPEDQ